MDYHLIDSKPLPMLKLQQLLNSTCTNVIRAVAKFVYKAFNDLWFYVIHVCRFCTFWYPVAILCNCVRHADQMFLSRRTFVRARGPKTIIKSLNPWILNSNDLSPMSHPHPTHTHTHRKKKKKKRKKNEKKKPHIPLKLYWVYKCTIYLSLYRN